MWYICKLCGQEVHEHTEEDAMKHLIEQHSYFLLDKYFHEDDYY